MEHQGNYGNKSTKASRQLIKQATEAYEGKRVWNQLCQEIALWFYPQRADFVSEINLGSDFASHMTDSTPIRLHRDLSNAMGTMLRPMNQEWFKLTVDGLDDNDIEAKQKLEEMTKITRNILYNRKSKFRQAAAEADRDFAAFGVSIMSITPARGREGILYRTWHPRDCAWHVDDNGEVNRLYRKDMMTARNMAVKFGQDKLPEAAIKALEDKEYKKEFIVWHCAIPRDMYEMERKVSEDIDHYSVYLSEDATVLYEAAEPYFPYVVSRWQTVSNTQYPFSPPTITALPDARMLQRMAQTIIESAEKSTDPPLIATSETLNSPVDIASGAITWVDREYDERMGDPLRPLELGKHPGIGIDLLERRIMDLTSSFFLDKLSLPEGKERRTAYEASQLVAEFIRNALPLFEPMESEVAGAQLDLTVNRAMKLGLYGNEFPESLKGGDISFDYQNPLRTAMDHQLSGQYNEMMEALLIAFKVDPSIAKQVDIPKAFRDTAAAVAPVKWLRPAEEAKKLIEEEMERQRLAEELEAAKVGSEAGKNIGQAAKDLGMVEGGGNE